MARQAAKGSAGLVSALVAASAVFRSRASTTTGNKVARNADAEATAVIHAVNVLKAVRCMLSFSWC